MAVFRIVAELIEESSLQPEGVRLPQSQGQRQMIRVGESRADGLVGEEIGIIAHGGERPVSKAPVKGDGSLKGQAVGGEEAQQTPHRQLNPEGIPHGQGALPGDPLNLRQQVGVFLHHREDVGAEGIHQTACGDGPHPLDGPGGQVDKDGLLPHGEPPLGNFRPQLTAIGAVVLPAAVDGQPLSRGGAGHHAHHGDLLRLLPQRKAQNGITVFLVAEHNGGDGAV